MSDDRRLIGARLLDDRGALVDAFVATLADQIPAYSALDTRQEEEVRSIIVWTLRRVLDLWADGGALTEEDLRLFRGVGAVRARDGRPLAAVLRAYRVAAVEFLDQVSDRFADEVSVPDVTSLIRVWFAVLDELSEAIYDGYESTGRAISQDRESSLRALFVDVLLGRHSHAATLTARLRELDALLPDDFDLVVARADEPARAAALMASTLDARVVDGASRVVPSIHAVVDGWAVVMLARVNEAALAGIVRDHGLRVARSGVTPAGAPRAHRLATHGIDRAPGSAWSGGRVLRAGDLEVLALATGHPDADQVRTGQTVLGPLVGDIEARATLEAVLQTGGAAQAAAALHLHPQSVRYRLRRVAAATDRDPRDGWNRYVFQTALLAGPAPAP